MLTKSKLAILLSKLKVFEKPNAKLEQYPTDSESAASVLWAAYMTDDIENKIIADFGAGTGILGIGALLLGAKKVYFVEKDPKAVEILKQNIKYVTEEINKHFYYEIINFDVDNFNINVDVVIQNPPFGAKEKHADIKFLDIAFTIAPIVYSMHNSITKNYIINYARKQGFAITNEIPLLIQLKQAMLFHKRKIDRIDAICFRFSKI